MEEKTCEYRRVAEVLRSLVPDTVEFSRAVNGTLPTPLLDSSANLVREPSVLDFALLSTLATSNGEEYSMLLEAFGEDTGVEPNEG